MIAVFLSLAFRNLYRHRGRTALTLGAIVFGVAALILSGGFVQDIFVQLGEALIHSQSGHLQVLRKGYYESGARTPEKYLIDQPDELRRRIAGIPDVDAVMARIAFAGLLNNGRSDWAVVGEGIEPGKESRLGTSLRIVAGRMLADSDTAGALVGQGVAQALHLHPGDAVTLLVNTPEGALNSLDLEVVGVFQSFSKDYDARAVRVPLQAAQDALSTRGVNALVVALGKTESTPSAADAIGEMLRASGLEVRTWVELNDFYSKTVALYDRQFGVLQGIILVMVLLSVANTVNMTIFERLGEFGTMMALGNTRWEVAYLILLESAILGVAGAALGVAAGAGLAMVVSAIGIPMPPPPNANLGYVATIRMVPETIVSAFMVGCLATVLASILPALRVTRTPVIDALRVNV